MISIRQLRSARALLGWDQRQLARRAGISIATYNNIERGAQRAPKAGTLKAIISAFEAGGIEFMIQPQGGEGVFLKSAGHKNKNATILIVDDNRDDRRLFKRWLEDVQEYALTIVEAANGQSGFNNFLLCAPDCIVLDFMMYGTDGLQLLASIKQAGRRVPPVIFVTGMPGDEITQKLTSQNVFACMSKARTHRDAFVKTVAEALQHNRMDADAQGAAASSMNISLQ